MHFPFPLLYCVRWSAPLSSSSLLCFLPCLGCLVPLSLPFAVAMVTGTGLWPWWGTGLWPWWQGLGCGYIHVEPFEPCTSHAFDTCAPYAFSIDNNIHWPVLQPWCEEAACGLARRWGWWVSWASSPFWSPPVSGPPAVSMTPTSTGQYRHWAAGAKHKGVSDWVDGATLAGVSRWLGSWGNTCRVFSVTV